MGEFTHTGLDFQHSPASGDALAILLAGQWIEGSILRAANLYVIAYGSCLVTSGYSFITRDGGMCGLCAGMKVRLG